MGPARVADAAQCSRQLQQCTAAVRAAHICRNACVGGQALDAHAPYS
jgi:hypothetical protein